MIDKGSAVKRSRTKNLIESGEGNVHCIIRFLINSGVFSEVDSVTLTPNASNQM